MDFVKRIVRWRVPGGESAKASMELFDAISKYQRPRPLTPLLLVNIVGFYAGLAAAAISEQLYKERYWEEHPGERVPIRKPWAYLGPYPVQREDFAEEPRPGANGGDSGSK
ncbi:hypothetical protein CBR_g36562 [Chara braunii]|uniref:Uncharacterized protein n=1 Tax=Chara braunii TaxID=69332 RepID=A0A388JZ78_CHABU|nr:hypothetical protein CBR_g36562 [Chara braunii]|eukprot:GBG63077.1 hypothetical protein CBR_g36562 [Chara braunii]